jgi:hypothetical protein
MTEALCGFALIPYCGRKAALAANRRLLLPLATINTNRGVQNFLVTHWLVEAIRREHPVWMNTESMSRPKAESKGEERIDDVVVPKLQGG